MPDSWKPVVVDNWRPGVNNSRVSEVAGKPKALSLQRLALWAALGMAALMLTAFVIFGAVSGGVTPAQLPNAGQATPDSAASTRISMLMRQLQAMPDSAEILASLAEAFLSRGDSVTAAEFARKALVIEPEDAQAAHILESALADRRTSRAEEAVFPENMRDNGELENLLLPGSTLHWSQSPD